MFKEMFTEQVFRDKNTQNWLVPQEIQKEADRQGLTICGIGITKNPAQKKQDSEFVFVYPFKGEQEKFDTFDKTNKNKNEKLLRYTSIRKASHGEFHTCIVNAAKGYMRFLENINEDPDILNDELIWSKPEKFEYLRVIY